MIPNDDKTIYAHFDHHESGEQMRSRVIAWGNDGKAWCWGQYRLVPVSDLECFVELVQVHPSVAEEGPGWQIECA